MIKYRFIRIVLISISTLMLIGFIFLSIGYRLVTRSLPDTSGTMHCEGLQADVQVFRDDLGIPYVLADNEADLFFTQGYITALDRFFQMDLNRHLADGRLAELFLLNGSRTDTLMRSVNLTAKAKADYQSLPTDIQLIFQSYSEGINAFLDQYSERLPLEYTILNKKTDPWQPEESLALLYFHAWMRQPEGLLRSLSKTDRVGNELLSEGYVKKILRDGYLSLPPLSNLSWIVSGKKSASGKPILASVYNESAVQPNIWYEMHLFSPDLRAGGLSLPGVPMILSGQNGAVVWASNVRQMWTHLSASNVNTTHLNIGFCRQLLATMRSRTVMNLQKAAGPATDSNWFILSADSSGGMNTYPPVEPRPTSLNGWIATDGARIVMDNTPLAHETWPLRRLADLLNADSTFTPYRMRQLQSDCRSEFAMDVLKHALPILETIQNDNPVVIKAIDQLSSWKGEMKPGSSEALIFQTWISLLFKQDDPDIIFDHLPQITFPTLINQIRMESRQTEIKQSFIDAIELLREKWGDNISHWSWGAARNVKFRHPLRGNPLLDMVMTLGPFHFGGSAMTLLGAGHSLTDLEHINWIQSARIIIPLDDLNRTFSALSTGQSGQPVDTHYRDQIVLFLSNEYHPNLTDINRIHRSGWELLTLNPGDENVKKE
ncbi:penicillin acylase family protein [candidate division KSB1 bacterium]|nr:penicillin acylase family protein [candidate division KSB1 bacterium]